MPEESVLRAMFRDNYHDNRYDKHINMYPPVAATANTSGSAVSQVATEPVAPYPLEDVAEVINPIPVYKSSTPTSTRPLVESSASSGSSTHDRYEHPFQLPPTKTTSVESLRPQETRERIPPPPYEESENKILQEKAYRTEEEPTKVPQPPRERKRDLSQYSPSGLKFYEIYNTTVKDSVSFTPEVQMKWCETLLEFAFDEEFLSHYNINAEKLKRELKPEEVTKNQKVILEHSFKVLAKLITMKWGAAMYLMGTLYSHQPYLAIKNKSIIVRNDKKALEYYCRAAKSNHSEACYRAGVCYEFQKGTADVSSQSESLTLAFRYYLRGAELCSNSACMYKLGMFCLYREDFQDVPQAMSWFKNAAKQHNSPQALYELGKIYEFTSLPFTVQRLLTENNITPNPTKALKNYYACATKCEYPLAQWKLGHCYEFGELQLPVIAKKSIAWYAKAALAEPKGNAMAMLALSGWYLTGATGVLQPNDQEAFKWALQSCEASDGKLARAEYALAYYYERAIGCTQDPAQARVHYERAARLGHSKAISRLQSGL